jgi:long-chain acyl-CoA synthetase
VVPEDVEKVYLEHPAIREIGLLLRAGRLAAVIVPDPARVRTSEVENAVRGAIAGQSRRLHGWQRVTEYAITRESLPRTRLGKLRRHLLPDLYERARQGGKKGPEAQRPARLDELSTEDRALLEHPAAGQVWKWLTTRYREQRVTGDTSPQVDLGVDSLEWLNLTLELRARAGIELSDETIAGIGTVRDLLRAATEASEAASPAASPLERPEETLRPEQRRWIEPPGALTRVAGIGFYGLNRAVLRRLFAVRARGLEHLPARDPFVLAPNHRSYLDPFVIACVVPRLRLETTYWGGFAPLLFANPPARLLSKVTHIVPVDPERAAISSLAVGAAVLARKRNLVWFPEGQRSRTGELQRFMPGLGMLLDHFRVPVVPVFVHGTEQALPPGRAFPRPVPVTVAFGPALDPEDLARRGRGKDAAERITDALRDAVAELGVRVAGGRRKPAA